MNSVNIELRPSGKVVQARRGDAFRRVAEAAGVDLRLPCGAKGRCGKCKVIFERGAPAPTATELDVLSETELERGCRLGCQTSVHENAVVHMPNGVYVAKVLTSGRARDVKLNPYIAKKHARIPEPTVEDLRSDLVRVLDALGIERNQGGIDLPVLRRLGADIRSAGFEVTGVLSGGTPIGFEPGDTTAECFGVAFDIGTTTLAAYLINLNSGDQLSVASAMNPQARVGDDVISRITYVMQETAGLEALQDAVVGELNKLIETLAESAGISTERIYEASVVGNTCMTHLFLGVDPRNLAVAPYVPTISRSMYVRAQDIGLQISRFGRVHVFPCIAGFVGGDTVGVIVATGLHHDGKTILAVDIGTNGEIVLATKGRILACSTAAGPAFEGAHIHHGMRAALGAIDSVWIDDGDIRYGTIGDADAVGICGSGLMDAVVCLVEAGVVEPSGRIVDADEVPEEYAALRARIRVGERGNEFVLAPADESGIEVPVLITQRDLREVQLAKGAIAAGIRTLMERLGVSDGDLDSIVLAGAFGNYIRKRSAVAAGMLPNVPLSKVHSVGNAAGEGAKIALVSLDVREDADRLVESIEYVELTTDFEFQERFADALMLSI